jgi:hypothetical protein
MTRSAFLSSNGDVLLDDFCLTLWDRHWKDEVDTMYVAINNHAEVPLNVIYEFLRKWEQKPKIRLIFTPNGIGNGPPITQMLFNSKEESLLLIENDSFIFTPGIVAGWFQVVESGEKDIVGSPRYAAGEIAQAAKVKYHLDYSGVGDKGFGWWPSFFVCKRADLLKTDLDFGSKEYVKDTYYKELHHAMIDTSYTDTFTWTSLQLRWMGLKSYDIPQNHAYPFDFMKGDHMTLWDKDPEYIHGGSLSSGWNGYLNKKSPVVNTEMEVYDLETRVAFWKLVADNGTGYEGFRNVYKIAIQNLILKAGLNWTRIETKYQGYRRIMGV